jgi:acyl-CoA synthetase (AMP-forming)/AMP-acid ligase II
VRERLAAFKAPRSIVLLEELPKVGSGKIDKRSLRSWTS